VRAEVWSTGLGLEASMRTGTALVLTTLLVAIVVAAGIQLVLSR